MKKTKHIRIGVKLEKTLIDAKERNSLKSLAEAGERMADFFQGIKKKKKIKERIIREIEF
ncbi:MAG: hypothetical protein WD512_02195 [Candidatus Paceibacterota bacterium]